MNDFWKHIATVLTGKDGPLIWGITAITALTLGWKFLDKNYEAEGDGWKICPSDTCSGHTDDTKNVTDESPDSSEN